MTLPRILLLVNLAMLAAMAFDKLAARRGAGRIRESTLLVFAALGASPGLWAGIVLFRHKIAKRGFLAAAVLATLVSVGLFLLARRAIEGA